MSIKFNDVNFIYSPHTPFEYHALKNINVEIEKGSFTAIVGHTGSGKSTMVQHINGLVTPTNGELVVEDFILSSKSKVKHIKNLRKMAGMVFQFPEYQLFEDNVEKDVSFGPKNFGFSNEEALKEAHEALSLVGLGEEYYKKSPFELSGGQKRRVAIAGIIASKPDILILDEPTAGLDPQGAKEMMQLFSNIHKSGVTIVLVTHDMDIVLEYASDVIVVQEGEIKEHCSPVKLFSKDNYEQYCLETPIVFKTAKLLISNGLKIDLSKINNIKSLATEIVKAKKVKEHE